MKKPFEILKVPYAKIVTAAAGGRNFVCLQLINNQSAFFFQRNIQYRYYAVLNSLIHPVFDERETRYVRPFTPIPITDNNVVLSHSPFTFVTTVEALDMGANRYVAAVNYITLYSTVGEIYYIEMLCFDDLNDIAVFLLSPNGAVDPPGRFGLSALTEAAGGVLHDQVAFLLHPKSDYLLNLRTTVSHTAHSWYPVHEAGASFQLYTVNGGLFSGSGGPSANQFIVMRGGWPQLTGGAAFAGALTWGQVNAHRFQNKTTAGQLIFELIL